MKKHGEQFAIIAWLETGSGRLAEHFAYACIGEGRDVVSRRQAVPAQDMPEPRVFGVFEIDLAAVPRIAVDCPLARVPSAAAGAPAAVGVQDWVGAAVPKSADLYPATAVNLYEVGGQKLVIQTRLGDLQADPITGRRAAANSVFGLCRPTGSQAGEY